MPILLPVRVRRSVRETTVAATRPAVAPPLTARAEFRPRLHPQLFQHGGIIIERMAGQEKTDRFIFAAQSLGRQPWLDLRQRNLLADGPAAEQFALPDRRRVVARCARPSTASTAAKTRARFLSNASNAPAAARLSSTRLLTARGLTRPAKSARSANGPLVARGDDRLDRLPADAFESGERVDDRVAVDLEIDRRAIDRRRIDLDAEPFGLGAEFGELVGIAHVERHGRRQELDRIIRLHVGGLIGDQRISRRVALVEAVFGEALEQVEDRIRLIAFDTALDRAGDETLALRLHLLADLLAHGAAQQIGFAERNSRQGSARPASPVPGR